MSKLANTKQRKDRRNSRIVRAADAGRSKTATRGRQTAKASAMASVRDGTKLADIIALLRRPEGATIDQIAKTTGWQNHSVRGAISGALKNKLGVAVTSTKQDGIRTYRITG